MPKVSVRKRLKAVKRERRPMSACSEKSNASSECSEISNIGSPNLSDLLSPGSLSSPDSFDNLRDEKAAFIHDEIHSEFVQVEENVCSGDRVDVGISDEIDSVGAEADHTYAKPKIQETENPAMSYIRAYQGEVSLSRDFGNPCSTTKDDCLLLEASKQIAMFLHSSWICHVSDGGVHVMLLSRKFEKAVQRRIFFSANGDVKLSVHCTAVPIHNFLKEVRSSVVLKDCSLGHFVDRCVEIVNIVRSWEVCAGISDEEYKPLWSAVPSSRIDNNPYQESRYSETLRSVQCSMLVPARRWHCDKCEKLRRPLHRRSAAFQKPEAHPSTPNLALSSDQKELKLKKQQQKINAINRKLERMKEKIKKLIEVEGVNVDREVSDDLTDILKGYNLTETQSLFLQQQLEVSKAKGCTGIRWHPSLIRFALALYMASPSCYEKARDSGMIKLPSQRTLFDYTHVNEAKEGVDDIVLEDVNKYVEGLEHSYQKYHVLLCDEMHICQNLVYKKSTGEMLGYVKLREAFSDIKAMENFMTSGDSSVKPELATKMLSFMIKGTSSDVKEVVASYSVNRLTTEFLYSTTWEVINRCERAGIAIVAFVSDGFTVNRSFIKKHNPANVTKSGLLYSTVNKSAPHRNLYFMSDVAHLLKTIRNCLLNSRVGKKSKRCLQKGGEKLLWQPIIDLYKEKCDNNLRKSYKLSAQNVYIDSYSAMKVKFAAEILSRTVAKDLEDMKWPGTKELVKFIRLVNDWFDCLNGAFSSQGRRKKNSNLDPYTSTEDGRFETMRQFVQYLHDWKEEVYSTEALAKNLTTSLQVEDNVSFDPVIQEEEGEENDPSCVTDTPAAKKLLSQPTLQGIEFTTEAFIGATQFLLKENTKFINARVFSQDHIEQRFGRQRDKGGPSCNPNYAKYLQNNVNLHLQGQLGIRKRKGNTEEQKQEMKISSEPLPKRKRPCTTQINTKEL